MSALCEGESLSERAWCLFVSVVLSLPLLVSEALLRLTRNVLPPSRNAVFSGISFVETGNFSLFPLFQRRNAFSVSGSNIQNHIFYLAVLDRMSADFA